MRILFRKCFLAVLILVVLAGISHAATFSDNFNDPNYTSSNWIDGNSLSPHTWSSMPLNGSDLGLHATVDSLDTKEPAVMIANNGQAYYNAGLYVETLVRIDSHAGMNATDNEKAFIVFSGSDDGSYLATIQLEPDGGAWRGVFYFENHYGDKPSEFYGFSPIAIDFDTFYKLVVQVDSDEFINAYLFDMDSTLLGNISSPESLPHNRGVVGIGGRYATTFNNFHLSGTPVPIPAAIWLLSSGLAGLGAYQRKLKR